MDTSTIATSGLLCAYAVIVGPHTAAPSTGTCSSQVDILVNNAGLALGVAAVTEVVREVHYLSTCGVAP